MSDHLTRSTTHSVLARKWRPKNFKEIVGQEHVLHYLTNALNLKRLHTAYLLTGTRGIGKTTLGRILAKCLSCEKGIVSTPCDQCVNCQSIAQGQFPDFYEIDAASHTKVEDIRELLSNVPYVPIRGRFKIYLIDEVHMLSNHSFNALLKTLEEPPEHVIFILATTDPEKLLPTILSRCLQFYLKALSPEQIESHLITILQKETILFEHEALMPIAIAAKGSLRDALTLLNQAIAFSNASSEKPITTQDVNTLIGTIDINYLISLLNALKQKDANSLMKITQQLAEKTVDFSQLLQAFASLFHQLVLCKIAPEATSTVDAKFHVLAQDFTLDEMQKYYQILLSGQQDLYLSQTPKMGAEMTLLRLLAVSAVKAKSPLTTSISSPIPSIKAADTSTTKSPSAASIEAPSSTSIEKSTEKKEENIKAIIKAFNAKLLNEEKST